MRNRYFDSFLDVIMMLVYIAIAVPTMVGVMLLSMIIDRRLGKA